MRWDFDSKATDGLRIIEFIPDLNPCLIEGRNGIGKTVAVQLLQVLSGQVPHEFAEQPDLWVSLRRRLNSTRVVGSGLVGCDRVEVEFTPGLWPDTPELDERLGMARIDGRAADIGDVAALLQVDRISGNEDLAESIERHRAVLHQQLGQVGTRIRERAADVQAHLGTLIDDLKRLSPEGVADLERDADRASQDVEVAREVALASAARLAKLSHLIEVIRKRDGLDAAEEDLLARHHVAAAKVRELERSLTEAQSNADKLAAGLRKLGGVAQDLAETSGLLRKRRNRAEQLVRRVSEEAGQLSVPAEVSEVAAAIAECSAKLRALARLQAELDASGQVRGALDVIVPTLVDAATRVGDQLLASGFSPELTVHNAAAALVKRSDELSREPTPAQVRDLAAQRRTLVATRQRLATLADDLSKLARARVLVTQAEADYARLQARDAAVEARAAESRAADAEVGRLQHELTSAHETLARLAQSLAAQGTISRQDAANEITQLTRELGVGEDDAVPAHATFAREVAAADANAEAARQRLAALQRRLVLNGSELTDVVLRLENSSWFPAGVSPSPLRSADGAVDLGRYAAAREAVLATVSAITGASELISRLEGISQELLRSGAAEPGGLDEHSSSLRAPLSKMLAARILAALNSPSIQRLVFGGATATDLDPVTRTLTLQLPTGDSDRRPLSSFSTGEQALAFTQARILDLQSSRRPNRLLVLDEFGAFVSADRLPELAEFLASPAVKELAGQVVVVLPLQVDYEAEVANTRGSLRETYTRRGEQIALHGFASEVLK